jgi:CxxC motif-containing protein (DUF1111 family)
MSKHWLLLTGSLFLEAGTLAACNGQSEEQTPGSPLSGGETTVFDASRAAFSKSAANIEERHLDAFFSGNALFNRAWVTAPASTSGLDGLGPTFNVDSCSGCHFKDGRGAPPETAGEAFQGLLLRLSVPGEDAHGGPLGDPTYGEQLNHRAILGIAAEASARVRYEERPGKYEDGTPFELLAPRYEIFDFNFGAMSEQVMISPRVAPAVHGLGLLQAIDASAIEALTDPDDEDGDGISGRANYVWDHQQKQLRLGRFGWKSNQPSLAQQTAGAFLGDMGLTSALFADQNCPAPQRECADAIHGGAPEIAESMLEQVIVYTHLLAVPARRDVSDRQVMKGERLFRELGCASCHIETFDTGKLADFPELSGQRIHPYTDLLLHDMGEGLADNRPDFGASGREWRTPPLWGIGLTKTVNRHERLLHDGRARGFAEAILWHGGEAEAARDAFVAARKAEREALLSFLQSL